MELRTALDDAAFKLKINLKDKQVEAIQCFLSGKDVFVSLPTGYGKSIIFGIYHWLSTW